MMMMMMMMMINEATVVFTTAPTGASYCYQAVHTMH